jgi:hypothetical protein
LDQSRNFRTLEIGFFFNAIKERIMSKRKVWVDDGLIGATDLPKSSAT